MLKFDAETTRLLETAYVGTDVTKRRRINLDALRLQPREHVVDIGCGNGLLCAEAARAVGSHGKVWGIDPSDDMRAAAINRCAEYPQVEIVEGTADALPLADNSVDKAVSIQVLEYIQDVSATLTEAARVLKSGGLLVVGDMHFGTFAWHSENPDRMSKMLRSWDDHSVHLNLPERLPHLLNEAGFKVIDVLPLTTCDHVLRPDGLAQMLLALMQPYAVENGHMSADEAEAWAQEQYELADAGKFFFSISHFVFCAIKP